MAVRNDDVAFDTKFFEIKQFCKICDKYGHQIIQSITPIGEVKRIKSAKLNHDRIKSLSNKKFSENKEALEYLLLAI